MNQLVNQHTDLAAIFAAKESADREMAAFHPALLEISARWHRDMAALLERHGFTVEAAYHRTQLQGVEAELAVLRSKVPAHV